MLRLRPVASVSRTCRPWLSSSDGFELDAGGGHLSFGLRSAVSAPPAAASAWTLATSSSCSAARRSCPHLGPFRLLGGDGRGVGFKSADLPRERPGRLLRLGAGPARPLQSFTGGPEATGQVRLLNLPVGALLPGGLLLGLQLGQKTSCRSKPLLEPDPA